MSPLTGSSCSSSPVGRWRRRPATPASPKCPCPDLRSQALSRLTARRGPSASAGTDASSCGPGRSAPYARGPTAMRGRPERRVCVQPAQHHRRRTVEAWVTASAQRRPRTISRVAAHHERRTPFPTAALSDYDDQLQVLALNCVSDARKLSEKAAEVLTTETDEKLVPLRRTHPCRPTIVRQAHQASCVWRRYGCRTSHFSRRPGRHRPARWRWRTSSPLSPGRRPSW